MLGLLRMHSLSASPRSIALKILLGFTVFLSLIWLPFLVSLYM